MESEFEIYRDDSGEWRWRLKAANGEIIASGESYRNRRDCVYVVELIRQSAKALVKIEERETESGQAKAI